MFSGWLTIAVFLPIGAALLIALFGRSARAVRAFAAAVSAIELLITVAIFAMVDTAGGAPQHQLVDRASGWVPVESFRVEYFLAVDGLSAPLVLLAGLLGMVAVFGSWGVTHRVREYFFWLLALQGAVIGVFTAMDFLLFFLFWELELIPMFFLISIWGSGRREYSAMKFLIFTILGSAFMLIGILALFFSTGTFDMTAMRDEIAGANLLLPAGAIFALLFIGFAVKLPLWPFHTWLPDAHTDAPTAGSVMLAGVLLKMGGYGMIRVSIGMFPDVTASASALLAAAAVINVIYGAIVVMRQTDLKRLIAFSSISHMGFVMLGLAAAAGASGAGAAVGLTGAAMQMFTHGAITGLLFLLVGFVYDKTHTRYIPDLGGLARRMPVLSASLAVAGLAALGLPGTGGFVAEIMVFLGAFADFPLITAIAAFGVVLAAGYILWTLQRVMFGPLRERFADLTDASPIQYVPIAALIIAIIAVGVFPGPLADMFAAGVQPIVDALAGESAAGAAAMRPPTP